MSNKGILSQEEIDALLHGSKEEDGFSDTDPVESLTAIEIDALGEIGNMSMGSAATVLSQLVNLKVAITTPIVSITSLQSLKESYTVPFLAVSVEYVEGLQGSDLLIMELTDAATIVDLMMGGDGVGVSADFDEIKLSAISEIMNQMMGSAATSMSTLFKRRIDITPPKVKICNLNDDAFNEIVPFSNQEILKVAFRMQIGDLIDSQIMLMLPIEFAKEMVRYFIGGQKNVPATQSHSTANPSSGKERQPEVSWNMPDDGYVQENSRQMPEQTVTVQPVQFQPLKPSGSIEGSRNIDLIMDVPMQVTVELGRTRKLIRDILEFSKGSIVELDKLAGEPVDILVNGKLIAKGEVVVIDENFGVRVTDIISPIERVSNLQ